MSAVAQRQLRRNVVAVLRGTKRCQAVRIGALQFYHFWKHEAVPGAINVPWVKDLRVQQFAQMGYVGDYLEQARHYLNIDKKRFVAANAFVAPTEIFAETVMRWYGTYRPWFQFANYPNRVAIPRGNERRREVVYVDNATTVFQEQLYRRVLILLNQIHDASGYDGVLIAPRYAREIEKLPHSRHVRVVRLRNYDYLSEAGLLVNVTGFRGAAESLPRKLLLYLHCGMKPLVHGTFTESVEFCRAHGVPPLTYYDAAEAAEALAQPFRFGVDRQQFCLEERIGDLMNYLNRLGG